MSLQRLVLSFTREGIEIRTLYRRKNGPSPGTKTRAREVTALAREGLREALETLEGCVDIVGSGYDVREDVIAAEANGQRRKGGAA
jgi:hypothetical protein